MVNSRRSVDKFRLGEERCAIAHARLNTHPKSVLGSLLSRTLNITATHLIFELFLTVDKKKQLSLISLTFFLKHLPNK